MPTTTYVNMLFLGNFDDVDTNEGNSGIEGDSFEGSHSDLKLIEIREYDANDSGSISEDQYKTDDNYTLNTGNGNETVKLDSISAYRAEVELGDGSVVKIVVPVLQMDNGDVFIRDNADQMDGMKIVNVKLTDKLADGYGGAYTNRSIENSEIVCFVAGTPIPTTRGAINVEKLRPGDFVITECGPKPLRWVRRQTVEKMAGRAPIRIAKGALGPNVPHRPLKLSPQHRVVVSSDILASEINAPKALVCAKSLMALSGVRQISAERSGEYVHLAFDAHHVIDVYGVLAETFWPGVQTMHRMSALDVLSLEMAAPKLLDAVERGETAYPILEGPLRATVIAAHKKSGFPIAAAAIRNNSVVNHVPV